MRDKELTGAWGSWVAGIGPWHLFGGLTYDPRRREGLPGPEYPPKHIRSWLGESERRLGRPIEAAIVALEYQRNGWPHYHPLLRLKGGLRDRDIKVLGQTWFERHGYARLETPRSVDDVAEYACKYLMKDLGRGDVMFWPRSGPLTTHQAALGGQLLAAKYRRRAPRAA